VPQNSVLSGGLRYASKLPTQVGKHGDRMSSERWDIELDYVMTFSRLDTVDVKPPAGASIDVPSPSPAVPGVTLNLPDKISLAHKWKNQYGIRIGGDYTILPNVLTVRAGYSFESDGITAGYHQLDFVPHKRFGLALGATVRILDLVDLSATYAYLIIPDVTNSVQNAAIRRPVSGSPRPGDDEIANAGTITQTASSLIVEVGIHL
jgi:long-subunit fatty acid transport protein